MPLGRLDVSDIPFDAVALLERFQLRLLVTPWRHETIPVPDDSFAITVGAHVFGDEPAREHADLVQKTGQVNP